MQVSVRAHSEAEMRDDLERTEQFSNCIQQLVEQGADLNVYDSDGRTLMHWAVIENNTVMGRLLVDLGAHPFVRDNKGKTPIHYAVKVYIFLFRGFSKVFV